MIVADGIYYALGLTSAGIVVSFLVDPWLGLPFYILGAFCLYFFRDPERLIPAGPVAVSPADGKVVAVKRETATQTRVSIFLNIFDVHVNRAPIGGTIAEVRYTKGKFHVASREECSTENEQNVVTVEGEGLAGGSRVVFKQIAGLIARRVVCWKKPGHNLERGELIGLIRFGSRVDVLMPAGVKLAVKVGDRVRGGSSVLAQLA